ncbi:hypothetical protein PV10_08656 [Exophiala mesophila]|uniref:N-acetyltransferase domain-containing protein n=1 Tax=Exophiala mesophila TaxID=212818 RepID=A0A0D1Z2S0_EXOME|nr:uncharacterized protein PV10_08656 [Exophiala mesophila]KIV89042.1 hypothetical protein PV10_08656 [Exophiala mesophila]
MAFDPFQLHVPHASLDVVVTAAKHEDGPTVIRALNDPRVHLNLDQPPFPYTEADWESWFKHVKEINDRTREEWQAMATSDEKRDVETSRSTRWIGSKGWGSMIRVRVAKSDASVFGNNSDRTEVMIGTIDVRRSGFPGVVDRQEQAAAVAFNDSLPLGDPGIVWEVGYYLISEYHGRGIMPATLQTLRSKVLVPLMNVHILTGYYFEGNDASRRVFEKCGFQAQGMVPDALVLPDSKARASGNSIGMGIMRWTRAGDSQDEMDASQST